MHQNTIVVNKLLIFLRTVGGGFVNQRCLVRYLAACSLRLYTEFVNRPDRTFWTKKSGRKGKRLSRLTSLESKSYTCTAKKNSQGRPYKNALELVQGVNHSFAPAERKDKMLFSSFFQKMTKSLCSS